jgi:integrase
MGAVNFYLKKSDGKGKNKRSLIYLQFKYGGNRLVYSFGQIIHPDNWNKNKQRVKNNKTTTVDGKHFLNDLLDNLKKECERSYNSEIKSGNPAPAILKQHLKDFIDQNKEGHNQPTLYKLIDRFISGEIKYKGKEKSGNTIKTYTTALGHLKEFEKAKKYPINYSSINLDFLYKYITYLRSDNRLHQKRGDKIYTSQPLRQNAIAKDIQIIKTFMKKAVTMGESTNLWHQHEDFTAAREDTDAVYLSEKEIIDLYKFDLSNNNRLESARDLFVFGCFVGLRYSDYSTIKPENIIKVDGENYIKMITQKTNDLVIIPCNPIVVQIFEKYSHNSNKLPKAISNQKFNEAIKEACQLAGLTETSRLSTDPKKELYKCISSHTARRSFATNLYLEGFPVIDLMKITGHKTERAFMRYIKVDKLNAAKRLNTHIKSMWSSKLLKVAG